MKLKLQLAQKNMKYFLNTAIIFSILVLLFSCGPTYEEIQAKEDSIEALHKLQYDKELTEQMNSCDEHMPRIAKGEYNGFKIFITNHYLYNEQAHPESHIYEYTYNCINDGNKDISAFKVRIEYFTIVGDYTTIPFRVDEFSNKRLIYSNSKICFESTVSTNIKWHQTNDPEGKIQLSFIEILYNDGSRYKK